jgi:hypothetical protein
LEILQTYQRETRSVKEVRRICNGELRFCFFRHLSSPVFSSPRGCFFRRPWLLLISNTLGNPVLLSLDPLKMQMAKIHAQVAHLFRNDTDLLYEFSQFLPDATGMPVPSPANIAARPHGLKDDGTDRTIVPISLMRPLFLTLLRIRIRF